ncbi:hypothetical protein WS68_20680 [Burkholderia sp. TSV86]|nr:hypothetical protein WS68_20680 [Burkholderia sp. TSV86]
MNEGRENGGGVAAFEVPAASALEGTEEGWSAARSVTRAGRHSVARANGAGLAPASATWAAAVLTAWRTSHRYAMPRIIGAYVWFFLWI